MTRKQDLRGNTRDRSRRRRWLLSPAAGFGGDGITVPCTWCPTRLTYTTLEVDRWPICGHNGGRYSRSNVVPSCGPCNKKRCDPSRKLREPLDN